MVATRARTSPPQESTQRGQSECVVGEKRLQGRVEVSVGRMPTSAPHAGRVPSLNGPVSSIESSRVPQRTITANKHQALHRRPAIKFNGGDNPARAVEQPLLKRPTEDSVFIALFCPIV